MTKERKTWRAHRSTQALAAVARIQASIESLDKEDLLDLHDIFRNAEGSPLMKMVEGEMSRRGLLDAGPATAEDGEEQG